MEYFVLGLGNPAGYEGTRHNIGKDFIEGVVRQAGCPWRRIGRCRVACVPMSGHGITCAVSDGFMNETGDDAREILAELEPSRVVVVHDDIDFDPGVVRLSRGKSAGGHNGVESVIRTLGTSDFWRLRIGVGKGDPVREYVLDPVPPDDRYAIKAGLRRALPPLFMRLLYGGGSAPVR